MSRSENVVFCSHLKRALPFEHQIDLVLLAVDMAFLLLPGLEAVDVAEEAGGLKNVVLLHLIAVKRLIIGQLYNFHLCPTCDVLRRKDQQFCTAFDPPDAFRLRSSQAAEAS